VSKWLLAPAKKADVPKLESTTILRIWPKGFGTIAFVMLGIFLTRSWFRNLDTDYSSYRFWKAEFTTSLFDTNNRTI
jgi:hypothetical protein